MNTVHCPYCSTEVAARDLERHQQNDVRCLRAQRVHDLCNRHFVLTHVNSPIYKWVTAHMRDTPVWEYDQEDQPWLPSWFCGLWFKAEKNPQTGQVTCTAQALLDTVLTVMKLERKKGALAVHARLLDIGFFDRNGGIYKSDCTTVIWEPLTHHSGEEHNGRFTREDYENTRNTMLGTRHPFTGTRYKP